MASCPAQSKGFISTGMVNGHTQSGKQLFEQTIVTAIPVEVVWDFLATPHGYLKWHPEVESILQWQNPDSDLTTGMHIELRLKNHAAIKYQMTEWIPRQMYGYQTLEDPKLSKRHIKRHFSVFNLFPSEAGTEIQWINYVEYNQNNISEKTLAYLEHMYHHQLHYLKGVLQTTAR